MCQRARRAVATDSGPRADGEFLRFSTRTQRRSTGRPRAQKPESFKFCFSTMSKTASKTTFAFFESVAVVS